MSLKLFKTYITYIYILLSGIESAFWISYTCLAFQQKHKILRWSVFPWPVNYFKPLNVYAKRLHLKCLKRFWIRLLSDYIYNVLFYHNKRLMGYLEFLYASRIICLPFNIPGKVHWQHLFEKPEEAETHGLYLS